MITRIAKLRSLLEWLGGHGPVVLLAALLVVLGTWAFVEIADEVLEGETQDLDEWAVRRLRKPDNAAEPVGPEWLHEVGRDLTALGGVAFMTMTTLGVAGYLLLIRKFHAMWLVLIATTGGLILSTVLKAMFSRERPDVPHLSYDFTSSFPSGHSMMAAVVYLTLGSLMTRLVENRIVKIYVLTLALLVTILVGVSRVYMGVHYPTDVLAGWTAGLVWALLCWLVARRLQIKGKVEKDTPSEKGIS